MPPLPFRITFLGAYDANGNRRTWTEDVASLSIATPRVKSIIREANHARVPVESRPAPSIESATIHDSRTGVERRSFLWCAGSVVTVSAVGA